MGISRHSLAQLGALLVVCAACSSQENADVSVAEFRVNECGSGRPSDELLMDRDPHDYPYLQCVAWKRADANLSVDLINFPAGCGFQGYEPDTLWKGRVREDNSKLDFEVFWDFGLPNGCGGCLHDFSFELEGVQAEGPLDMQVSVRDCSGSDCDGRKSSLTLPTDEHASGITCKYGGDAVFGISFEDQRGSLHAPPEHGSCNTGLEPIKVDGQELCVAVCSSDEECRPSDVLTCQKGKCLLRASW